jgi:hypothetical protein
MLGRQGMSGGRTRVASPRAFLSASVKTAAMQVAVLSIAVALASAGVGRADHRRGSSLPSASAASSAPTWKLQHTPEPPGATFIRLSRVSCPARNVCVAVGASGSSALRHQTLIVRWIGHKWRIQESPNPARSTSAELDGVSCTSARACMAVGTATTSTSTKSFAERWNGSRWSEERLPTPAHSLYARLRGISCAAPDICTAVGSAGYEVNGSIHELPLAERWQGHKWRIQVGKRPPGSTSSAFTAVSCPSRKVCVGVGSYLPTGADTVQRLVERWSGRKWKVKSTPSPAGSMTSYLVDVSCGSARTCTAVGGWSKVSGSYLPLAERYNGNRWRSQHVPLAPGSTGNEIDGVSCASARACTGIEGFQAWRWNGKRWTSTTLPQPSTARGVSGGTVSCISPVLCTAAGAYNRSSTKDDDRMFAERYSIATAHPSSTLRHPRPT